MKNKDIIWIAGITIVLIVITGALRMQTKQDNTNELREIVYSAVNEALEAEKTASLEAQEGKDNTIDKASLEELISEVEERTANPTMDTICLKLESYAKGLDDGVRFGVTTLSEAEMEVLRQYIKNNFQENDRSGYRIEGTDENVSGIGLSEYNGYKFIVHPRRQVSFIGPEFRKPIGITNSLDYSDRITEVYKKTVRDIEDGYVDHERYNLYTNQEATYTYLRDYEDITIEKWKFGEKVDEWTCESWSYTNIWYGAPEVLYWNEENDEYSLIAEAHLLLLRDGKIITLADNLDYDTKVDKLIGIFDGSIRYEYTTNGEVHRVDIKTLEDVIVSEK